jgi:hypothetical protein
MSSTQLKKARKWLTQMQSLQARGKNGMFTLPMMSQKYTLRTVEERNDKGSWFGWEVSRIRQLDLGAEEDKEMFEIGFGFAKAVRSGEVKVKETSEEPAPVERDNIPF